MFNSIEQGKLIKKEREKLSLTRDVLADKIGITRQTLSIWESGGGRGPASEELVKMAAVFDCEVGYLVGEFAEKTHAATDVKDETGLSTKAVENLIEAQRKNMWFSLKALNELLADDTLYILYLIGQYLTIDDNETVEMPDRDTISKAEIMGIQIDRELSKLRMKYQLSDNCIL